MRSWVFGDASARHCVCSVLLPVTSIPGKWEYGNFRFASIRMVRLHTHSVRYNNLQVLFRPLGAAAVLSCFGNYPNSQIFPSRSLKPIDGKVHAATCGATCGGPTTIDSKKSGLAGWSAADIVAESGFMHQPRKGET